MIVLIIKLLEDFMRKEKVEIFAHRSHKCNVFRLILILNVITRHSYEQLGKLIYR